MDDFAERANARVRATTQQNLEWAARLEESQAAGYDPGSGRLLLDDGTVIDWYDDLGGDDWHGPTENETGST